MYRINSDKSFLSFISLKNGISIILHKGLNLDFPLLDEFREIINSLTWKNKACVIFGLYARKLGNTFWYYENDQKQIERLIMRNYENINP